MCVRRLPWTRPPAARRPRRRTPTTAWSSRVSRPRPALLFRWEHASVRATGHPTSWSPPTTRSASPSATSHRSTRSAASSPTAPGTHASTSSSRTSPTRRRSACASSSPRPGRTTRPRRSNKCATSAACAAWASATKRTSTPRSGCTSATPRCSPATSPSTRCPSSSGPAARRVSATASRPSTPSPRFSPLQDYLPHAALCARSTPFAASATSSTSSPRSMPATASLVHWLLQGHVEDALKLFGETPGSSCKFILVSLLPKGAPWSVPALIGSLPLFLWNDFTSIKNKQEKLMTAGCSLNCRFVDNLIPSSMHVVDTAQDIADPELMLPDEVILWRLYMKCTEWQPWPPRMSLEIDRIDVELRPRPWASFVDQSGPGSLLECYVCPSPKQTANDQDDILTQIGKTAHMLLTLPLIQYIVAQAQFSSTSTRLYIAYLKQTREFLELFHWHGIISRLYLDVFREAIRAGLNFSWLWKPPWPPPTRHNTKYVPAKFVNHLGCRMEILVTVGFSNMVVLYIGTLNIVFELFYGSDITSSNFSLFRK